MNETRLPFRAHLRLLRRRRSHRPEPARRPRTPFPRTTAVTSTPADTASRPHTRRRQRGSVASPSPKGCARGAPDGAGRGRQGGGAGARAGGAVRVRYGFQDLRWVVVWHMLSVYCLQFRFLRIRNASTLRPSVWTRRRRIVQGPRGCKVDSGTSFFMAYFVLSIFGWFLYDVFCRRGPIATQRRHQNCFLLPWAPKRRIRCSRYHTTFQDIQSLGYSVSLPAERSWRRERNTREPRAGTRDNRDVIFVSFTFAVAAMACLTLNIRG